jgi:tetratricopeptide (TPR) repeat protein
MEMRSPLMTLASDSENLTVDQLWEIAQFYLKVGKINQSLMLAYHIVQQDNQQQQNYQNHCLKALHLGAEIAEEIEDYQRSAYYWEQLTKQQPRNPVFWYGLGIAKANLRDYQGAKVSLNYCLQLQPNHPKARQQLNQISNLVT